MSSLFTFDFIRTQLHRRAVRKMIDQARFHFSVNGEYYGGYLRSVAMGVHQSETLAKGTPQVNVRYNPKTPTPTSPSRTTTPRTSPSASPPERSPYFLVKTPDYPTNSS